MVEFDELTEEQMDDLTQQVLDLYTTISEEALSINDPDVYAKVRKITNDDDYSRVGLCIHRDTYFHIFKD